MREISTPELQQLGHSTARTLVAYRQARKDAQYYRAEAEHFKTLAADTRLSTVQASRLRIATIYERLAELAESTIGRRELEDQGRLSTLADDARSSPIVAEDGALAFATKSRDLRVSARAYSANVKTQIARQEAVTPELSNDDRQIASAALVKLSRTLCEISVTLSRETREKLRLSRAPERFL